MVDRGSNECTMLLTTSYIRTQHGCNEWSNHMIPVHFHLPLPHQARPVDSLLGIKNRRAMPARARDRFLKNTLLLEMQYKRHFPLSHTRNLKNKAWFKLLDRIRWNIQINFVNVICKRPQVSEILPCHPLKPLLTTILFRRADAKFLRLFFRAPH